MQQLTAPPHFVAYCSQQIRDTAHSDRPGRNLLVDVLNVVVLPLPYDLTHATDIGEIRATGASEAARQDLP